MHENEIAHIIVDKCFKMHKELGPGLLESVYEGILYHELLKSELSVVRQKPLPVVWDGVKMDQGFRVDLLVENKVIIEVKSVETVAPVHQKQVLTYLRLADIKLGLLVNFNVVLIKEGIQRIVNSL